MVWQRLNLKTQLLASFDIKSLSIWKHFGMARLMLFIVWIFSSTQQHWAQRHCLDFIVGGNETFLSHSRAALFSLIVPPPGCPSCCPLFLLTHFYRASYDSTVLAVIVCLSVHLSLHLSVTSRTCTTMAKPMITQTTPYDSPGNIFFYANNLGKIPTTSRTMGAPNRGGVGSHRRFSTNISLYLRNRAR